MDCLSADRVRECGIDELGSLNSIVHPSRMNFLNNCHFIPSRKLGRAASMVILLVIFNFLGNSAHCPLAYTIFSLDLTMRIPLIEVKNNRRALSSRNGFHDGGKKLRSSWNQFQYVKLIQIKSHDIVYCSHTLFYP